MAASNPRLWNSVKTSRRLDHDGEIDPIAVQIAGSDPEMMAEAAVFNVGKGARSEEHTSELQSLMRISYAVFCLKKKHTHTHQQHITTTQPHTPSSRTTTSAPA